MLWLLSINKDKIVLLLPIIVKKLKSLFQFFFKVLIKICGGSLKYNVKWKYVNMKF